MTILQLEQQGKSNEAEITSGMLKKAHGDIDSLQLKLQVSGALMIKNQIYYLFVAVSNHQNLMKKRRKYIICFNHNIIDAIV